MSDLPRGQAQRSEAHRRVERDPGNVIAWIVLAEHELDAGDVRAGEFAARRALELQPGHPEALARLGRAQSMSHRRNEAVASLRAAAANAPHHPGIAVWLAHALEDVGEAEAASDSYARAHALAADEAQLAAYLLAWRRKLCDWRDLERLSAQTIAAVRSSSAVIEPFAFLSEDSTAAEQLQCARSRARQILQRVVSSAAHPMQSQAEPIRVGFLSNGFGAHPTGLLTVALLEAVRTQTDLRVHLFATTGDDGSLVRKRLQAASRMHDVSAMSHADIAAAIRQERIEILFDLRGWGGGGAPEVLAMRPAPVQVNWLAYPGTSGAPWIDYVLADRFVLPATSAAHFSESVAWLPGCFQPSDTRREIPAPPSREDCGLPVGGVVFCCFNNSYKMNPASFARLLTILGRVPDSVLWLLSGPGHADRRLRSAAQQAGIDPARLVFMAKQPHAEYLARLRHADLFLDTNPYNAHTTASDALWAGCPVLTRPGDTFAARVAGSLNHHLGMPGMNVADDAAYIDLAVELGRDRARLGALREDLQARKRDSALFDMDAMAGDFAVIVTRMAERHRQHLPPAPLS